MTSSKLPPAVMGALERANIWSQHYEKQEEGLTKSMKKEILRTHGWLEGIIITDDNTDRDVLFMMGLSSALY